MDEEECDSLIVQDLLEELNTSLGYDFREYTRPSILRRIRSVYAKLGCSSIEELLSLVRSDRSHMRTLISGLTVNVTEMFRDPTVYAAIRREVIPVLRTYPSIRIWHAGCATGEEVYSMAILLHEEGLYEKCFLYGTDISHDAIEKAKQGIYSAEQIQAYTSNYQRAGGLESFSAYYTAKYDSVRINESLRKNILFAQHSLVADELFSEVHMIFCRNVLIYFSRKLQDRALGLFHRGLVHRGYLCLGTKETTEFSQYERAFEAVLKSERIFRKC
ncbi:MAG: protein-glutamate O-methyltransferase CheR [Bdellovibrionales bacterium]